MTALWQLDATALGGFMAAGEVSAVELTRTMLERIERLNPELNAIIAINDQAIAEAEAAQARYQSGAALGPLDGVPVTVKDNLLVQGLPATWGSRVYADYVPDHDELPIARLRAAGAVILGKTNAPEFTLEGYTANALFGVTGNPWNPALTPGGSSGGAVASVASGMAPVALGTDGGGSIRRPAGYAGLVGLKSSIGRVPRLDGFPQLLLDFEVAGAMTRTVRDSAMLFSILAGRDPRVWRSRLSAEPARVARGLRVLYVERFGEAPLDPAIAQSCQAAAGLLRDLRHQVESGPLPLDLEKITAVWGEIGQISLARLMESNAAARQTASEKYVAMADQGAALPASRLLAILELVDDLRAEAALLFERYDVIMTPSSAAQPWPAADAFPTEIDGQAVGPRGHAVYTGWVNAIGHPAINLPARPAPDGMPIGYQLIGPFGGDEMLLSLAEAIEKADPWQERWPAIALNG